MAFYILTAKELNGGIYITRLPQAIVNPDGSVQPGIPDNWYFVGPGTNPNVQEYSGSKFILTFTYLSHLNVRIVDIATWPPTEVVPYAPGSSITIGNQTSGSGAPQDSLTLKIESSDSFGLVAPFFKPPLLQQPLLFLDPATSTYSVTIQPLAGWAPDPPVGVQVFYRLYTRPFPYTGPWVLTTDWTLSAVSFPWFSFPFASIGSLRDQFSVTWGDQFLPSDQWNPNAHAEGVPGQFYVTVDSTTQHANAQAFINEYLTLDLTSMETFGFFGTRQQFLAETADDSIGFSKTLVGVGTGTGNETFFVMEGNHIGFVQPAAQSDSLNYSKQYQQGNTLQAVMG